MDEKTFRPLEIKNREVGLGGLESIVPKENFDSGMTFRIEKELDESGKEINADVFWVRLLVEDGQAEGKLWLPKEGEKNKLIIFEPGMPGDSVTWMEERHVSELLDTGYCVFVLRHLGTKTGVENSQNYVHSPERVERAGQEDKPFIGEDRDYTVEETSHEVSTATNALGKSFEEVTLIGHSSGVINTLYSFKEIDSSVQEKIDKVIALSGFVVKDGFTKYFQEDVGGLEAYYEYCAKVLRMGDPKINVEKANRMLADIDKRGKDVLPKHVMLMLLNAPNDEFMRLEGSKEFVNKILGRGTLIRDDTQFTGELHALEDMKTAQLLRMLDSQHLPGIKITERLTRSEQRREALKEI